MPSLGLLKKVLPRSKSASSGADVRPPSGGDDINSASRSGRVTREGSTLCLDGTPFRFASLNAPELLDGDVSTPFEVEDTMLSLSASSSTSAAAAAFGPVPVTRTYTLRIKSQRVSRGHINGWNKDWGDWEWDSGRLKEMDIVLDAAMRHGVKLIIPLLNADCNGQETNWVGDTTDLVRFRKGLSSYEEARTVDFYNDTEMINGVKLIIDKLLSRKNSINGRLYKDDPTLLAIETGNELHRRGYAPAPGSWTTTIARHVKRLAPALLVMDGSFARTESVESCYAIEALQSPDVDIFSYHYYGSGEINRIKKDVSLVHKYSKVFIAGEYGFFDKPSEYDDFLSKVDTSGAAGSLVWSLRPHSAGGGFKTHGEDHGNWSYHLPGWKEPLHAEFDSREAHIVNAVRRAAFKINKQALPPFPAPMPPSKPWLLSSPSASSFVIAFRGSAWADHYEVLVSTTGGGDSRQIVGRLDGVMDCTKEGCLAIDCTGIAPKLTDSSSTVLTVLAVGRDGTKSLESDPLPLR